MKQEAGKKTRKWLIPVIIVLALLLIGGGVAAILLLGNGGGNEPAVDPAGRADIYWNIDRGDFIDPATSLSIREPGEDGLYHIRFAFNGEQVELTVADKKLVNRIDMLDYMGLVVDGDGNVTDCKAPGEICTIAAENFFVQKQEGNVITTNSSGALNGMAVDYTVTENTGIYNVSSLAEFKGQVDTVQPMDKVVVLQNGAGETTHIFIVERPVESDVYWRVERFYANKETTRTPDENGVYHILFAVNGEQVELACKDKDVVTKIDAVDNNIQAMGLVFDEEGFIIDTMSAAMAVRGSLVSNQFDVTEINGRSFKTQRMLPSSNQGATWEGVMSENCKIYEVSGVADFIGQEIDELKVTDRVYVLTNAMGEVEIIFVTNRMVDGDLYWLATRSYDNNARTTTLKPASDGYYYMEFVVHGELVTLRSNDLEIVNKVQAPTLKAMGLELDGDVITKVYHYVNITGGWVVGNYTFVESINGPIVNTVSSSGSTTTFVMSADCEVMNVCFSSPKVMGEYTELQVGDRVVPLRNAQGEVIVCYVNLRKVDAPVYWNTSRSYSSAKKETTRTPLTAGDWQGYYEFYATTGGNRPVKLYTKSKELATKIDSKYPQAVGLKVSGSVITAAYGADACTGGSNMANYCHVENWENQEPDADGIMRFYAKYRATGNGTTVKYTKDTKIYNVSPRASYIGVAANDVKLDDRITVFTDRYGVAQIIYIVDQSPIYGEPYYNMEQKYSSAKRETTRVPDENGYYVFDKIVYKGEVITVKTKSKNVATEVDSYGIGMYMHVYNGIVTRAFGIQNLANYGNNKGPNFDIVKISGRTLSLERTRPSASNQGDTVSLTLSSSCKFYDVSPYAEKPGAVITPKVGDRVVIYQDNDNKVGAIGYVTMRHTREAGAFGLCEHCNKEVYWNHWEGSFPANAGKAKGDTTLHYYMPTDREFAKQIAVGNEKQTVMDAVLDLNGKTLSSKQRTLLAWYGATINVMDSSKEQTGTVIGCGDPSNKDGAGVAFTSRGGSIAIFGGNWKVADEHYTITNGGIVNSFAHKDFKGGTIVINGGKFYGTQVTGNGATVSCNTGEIIINGGEFFGGEAGNVGGTIHSADKLTLNGGIIHGGKAAYGATVAVPNLFVNGGTIEIGEASKLGNCMYISSSYNATITGGVIDDIWINSTWNQEKAFVKISGAPTIKNMDIAAGKLIDATGITGGNVAVNATGVFTTEFATEAAAQDALKYFSSSSDLGTVAVEGKQLSMGIYRCLYGHSPEEHETMECDQEILTWSMWNDSGKLPTNDGCYILSKDVTTSSQTSIAGKSVIIDLNGFDITYKIPTARTQNFRLFYINDDKNSNGKEADTVPGALIITDNSTDDVTMQGTVSSILPEYAPNYADQPKWEAEASAAAIATIEAEAKAAALVAGEEGSAEYQAEYEKQYAAIYAEKYDALVAKYIEDLLASYKATHEAGASGMLVYVAHGNFGLLGGNLDASNLNVKGAGVAVATGKRLETMASDAQNVAMMGGTITGGTTTKYGGAINVAEGTSFAMIGGTVNGGTLSNNAHGGAISGAGEITISGGTVNGGTGATNSGAIYAESDKAVVTIDGTAVINPGEAVNGDSMYVRFGTWNIGGNAKIYGGIGVSKASLTVSGAPTIVKQAGGSEYSLKLVTKDKLITFKDLEDGAKIAITGLGKFSTEGDVAQMQEWINKGYFSAEAEGKAVVVQGGALSVADADAVDKVYCVYGHLSHEGIECEEPLLTWSKWEDTTALPSAPGNYYLADNSTITTVKNLNVMSTETVQINLDLRGSTVLAPNAESMRLLLLRASNESCYTITDTLSGGTIKSTATKLGTSMSGDLFFAYNGLIRTINVTLDASSVVENANQGSAVYVENYNGYVGSFMAEGCTIIGGNAKNGEAIAAGSGCSVILKDTAVTGGYYQNASAKNVYIVGNTKLLPGTYNNFGVKGSNTAAEFKCQDLGTEAELIVANCNYVFVDEAAAQAAVTNNNIKPVEGKYLEISGKIVKVLDKPSVYCVYGHTTHEGSDCTEELLTWTKWDSTNTLPTVAGNYILTGNVTVANQTNIAGVAVAIDLNGYDITYKIPAARRSTFSVFNITENEGTTGSLIITDTSSTDVAAQGVVSSVLPAYAASAADLTKAQSDAEAYAAEQGFTAGTPEYEAAVTAKYNELVAGLQQVHDKGASGMLVNVAKGTYRQVGGNLDATGLTTGASGQAVYVAGGCSATIEGGTVSGGKLYNNAHGAAISTNGALVITGNAVINGGTGATNSGAVYAGTAAATVTINGNAVVNPGKATNGDAMYVRFGTWTIGGKATINGGVSVSKASLTVTGAPTILKQEGGSAYSLKLATADIPITFSALEYGAKIGITPAGVNPISTPDANMQSWIDAEYFVCEDEDLSLGVKDDALYAAEFYCVYGHKTHAGVDCAEPILGWTKWTGNKLPNVSGNYYLPAGTEYHVSSQGGATAEQFYDIKIDLRGNTVIQDGDARLAILKGTADSQYIITDTVGGAALKTSKTESNISGGAAMLYANIGTVRVIGVTLDSSSITTNATANSVAVVLAKGKLILEDCVVKGGASSNGCAITHNPAADASVQNLVLKDTAVEGGVCVNGSALRVKLEGLLLLTPGVDAYGLMDTVDDATFQCQNLADGSKIVAANAKYEFGDADKAATALENGVIEAVSGKVATVVGTAIKVGDPAQPEKTVYCVYGHENHDNVTCSEPILTWTKWTDTTKLPGTAGNYYVPAGSTITTTTNLNVITDDTATQINLDLRGSTVLAPNKENARLLLVRVANGGGYTITSTQGKALIKTTAATLAESNMNGDLIYSYNGLVRVINTDLDASSITTNNNVGSAVYTVNYNGYVGNFTAENSVITGGAAKNGDAITNSAGATLTLVDVTLNGDVHNQATADVGGTMIVKNSTINGLVFNQQKWVDSTTTVFSTLNAQDSTFTKKVENTGILSLTDVTVAELYHNCTGSNLTLSGVVMCPNMYTGHPDCAISCTGLAAGSNLVVNLGTYKFADKAAADQALADEIIKAGTGKTLEQNENTFKVVEKEKTVYCVYGHENHDNVTCSEPILTWTKWEGTNKLPTAAGNYYVPEGSTLELSSYYNLMSTEAVQVNLDLRGSTVKTSGNASHRMLLVRTAPAGGYTITSTQGQAVLKTTAAELTGLGNVNGALLYCYQGKVRVINTDLDASSVTTNDNVGSAVYVIRNETYEGEFVAENCTITGGVAKYGDAIFVNNYYNENDDTNNPGKVTLKDTTVAGVLYHANSAKYTVLAGNTKVAVNGGNDAATIDCTQLGANAEIVVHNCACEFGTATAAQAAIDNGNIKPAAGKSLVVNGTKVQAVEIVITDYCVYGHTEHVGEYATCTEPILTWTKWTDTTKLPSTAGNYYVPAGSTITTTTNLNVITDDTATQINLDLRGSTVLAPNKESARLLLVRVANGGGYTITSTQGKATIKTTAATLAESNMNGDLIYSYNGLVRVINTDLDASSITSNKNQGSAVYVANYNSYKGSFIAENSTITGGASKEGNAIYALGDALTLTNCTVNGGVHAKNAATTLTDTTVTGKVKNAGTSLVTITDSTMAELFHNGGKANIALSGVVEIDKLSTYHPDATIPCENLTAGSKIGLFGGACSFADPQAAMDSGMIAAAKGAVLTVNTTDKVVKVSGRTYCVNGHYAAEDCAAAGCTEPILTWTPKAANITSLPTTSGNYYLPDGANVNLSGQAGATDAATKYEVRVDLRGATVTLTDNRLVILRGTADSQFVITSTKGQAKVKTSVAEITDNNRAPIVYAYVGTVSMKNVDLDASSVTSSSYVNGTAVYVAKTGTFKAENCTITGASMASPAIYAAHANDDTSGTLVLKDTVVNGGLYITGSAAKMTLEGVVKLLCGSNSYGFKGGIAAAEINCRKLAEGSLIEAANCNFSFADADKATAAKDVIIKAITGCEVVVRSAELSNQLTVQATP